MTDSESNETLLTLGGADRCPEQVWRWVATLGIGSETPWQVLQSSQQVDDFARLQTKNWPHRDGLWSGNRVPAWCLELHMLDRV